MAGGAQPNNKNAEKWTLEESQRFLSEVYQYVLDNEDCCSISEACSNLGWYETLFNYIEVKHKSVEFEPIKKAKELIKQRIIKYGLKNEYNPTMSIFILKTNHDMQDKQVVEQKNTNINLTPEQIKNISDNLDDNI